MSLNPQIHELLSRWEEARAGGRALTPEDLCHECPHLVEELRRQIGLLVSAQRFLDLPTLAPETATPPASPDVDKASRESATMPTTKFCELPGQPHRITSVPAVKLTDDKTELTSSRRADWPTIAGYEILDELGDGGMGIVYKARQVGLDRLVALKMIKAGAKASRASMARFLVEAQAVARLQHPSIVQIYEIGDHQGLPYFSLEYCPGGDLARRLKGKRLAPMDAARLTRQLAEGMEAAHVAKIIHRDLKPQNILLGTGADSPTESWAPKIADFGLAKLLDEEGQTQTGDVMGTVKYMAPEQAQGKIRDIGPATDIYALGVILYEVLTGRTPFVGSDILMQLRSDDPAPPLRRFQPEIPQDLEAICLKCLEKEPAHRYARARDLATDLVRFMSGDPVSVVPVDEREWLARRWRKRGYEILGELGKGGMGVVYKARQLSLNRLVALKVILGIRRAHAVDVNVTGGVAPPLEASVDQADPGKKTMPPAEAISTDKTWPPRTANVTMPESTPRLAWHAESAPRPEWHPEIGAAEIRRFRMEAEAVAQLQHPNILHIYDFGEFDQANFIAMELAEGGTLAQKINGAPQPSRLAAELVETLARAMEHVHARGIIHRDLKPGNVLFDTQGIPKIADFGLVLPKGQDLGDLEPEGNIVGTPSYMSPEQAEGKTAQIGPQTDVYSLGAILYEMLTGRPPFRRPSLSDTIMQVIRELPVPPRQLVPQIRAPLNAICLKCLNKEPGERYESAWALADDLRRLLQGERVLAWQPSLWERCQAWASEHPRAFAFWRAVAAIVVLVISMSAAWITTGSGLIAAAVSALVIGMIDWLVNQQFKNRH